MTVKQTTKTRTTLIQRFRKRISGIRGGRQGRDRQRPSSPASVLDFPADGFPSSPLSSPTISNVPPTTVPYDPESMAASPESSLFVQHEVIQEDVDAVPRPSQTPNVTIHTENNVGLKILPTNRKVLARISFNAKKSTELKGTKQSLFPSPVAKASGAAPSRAKPTVPNVVRNQSGQSPPSASVENETVPATQEPLNVQMDKPKIVLPTGTVEVSSPPPVASGEAAPEIRVAPAVPTSYPASETDTLIQRKVRILKHPKDKRYKNKIGRISKKVRKNTYTVEFDNTDFDPIDKTFKTMELLPADIVESEHVPVSQVSDRSTGKEHELIQEEASSSEVTLEQADEIQSEQTLPRQLSDYSTEQQQQKSAREAITSADEIHSERVPTFQISDLGAEKEPQVIRETSSSVAPEPRSTRVTVVRNPSVNAAVKSSTNGSIPRIGQRVKILRHRSKQYVGKIGHVQKQVTKNTFHIVFPHLDPINKQSKTLEILEDDGQSLIQQSVETASSSAEATSQSQVLRSVASDATQKRRGATPRSQRTSSRVLGGGKAKPENPFQSGDQWRVPDSEQGGIRLGRRRITKIRTSLVDNARGTTLLSHLLGNRVLEHDNPISEFELEEPFARNLEQAGHKYELVATKVHADGDKGSAMYCKPKVLRLTYAEVQGPSLEEFSTADYLERLANFSTLEPRKAKARLELLQSPAHMLGKNEPAIFHLPDDAFTTIQDNGESQGCGFISEQLLESMFGNNAQARRIIQIQVRIVVPKLGAFKGTLERARDVAGIQLFPASMEKVPASIHPDAFDGGVVLVCQGGVHPSPINEYIGRRLDPNAKPPPEKSFKSKIQPLSDMITRLWRGMGVPQDVCSTYAKNSRSTRHINHAWVCGAADFSNSLPAGHVFVTGLTKGEMDLDEIFVTRSPCMEPTDGRMLPLVKSRPEGMSIEDWEWLNHLTFGSIIFANPPEGMKTLPEHIADGDLDGDRYFICWDPTVLRCIKAAPITDIPVPSPHDSTGARNNDADWFGRAQDWMLASATTELKIQQLTGKLFSMSNKIADDSPLYNKDPDAIAFAAAYKQALDVGKHGGPIFLPAHLHDKLPEALRPFVTGTK